MRPEPTVRTPTDIQQGTVLLVTGAVVALLQLVLPIVAPLAVAAYGIYQLTHRRVAEGLIALAVSVALWVLRVPLGWLLWLVAAGFAGFGLFLMIRGSRQSE